jgi:hypothetical protein
MRRDAAAAAPKSWPDTNYQFSQFREADSRMRGPRQGRDAIGKNQSEDASEGTARHRSLQWQAAEALFRSRAA